MKPKFSSYITSPSNTSPTPSPKIYRSKSSDGVTRKRTSSKPQDLSLFSINSTDLATKQQQLLHALQGDNPIELQDKIKTLAQTVNRVEDENSAEVPMFFAQLHSPRCNAPNEKDLCRESLKLLKIELLSTRINANIAPKSMLCNSPILLRLLQAELQDIVHRSTQEEFKNFINSIQFEISKYILALSKSTVKRRYKAPVTFVTTVQPSSLPATSTKRLNSKATKKIQFMEEVAISIVAFINTEQNLAATTIANNIQQIRSFCHKSNKDEIDNQLIADYLYELLSPKILHKHRVKNQTLDHHAEVLHNILDLVASHFSNKISLQMSEPKPAFTSPKIAN